MTDDPLVPKRSNTRPRAASGSRIPFVALALAIASSLPAPAPRDAAADSPPVAPTSSATQPAYGPGVRVMLDAHNCYPYHGLFADRIDRALTVPPPVAIEQDLVWFVDPATGEGRSIVSHGKPLAGTEPTLRDHFFEKLRPRIEASRAARAASAPALPGPDYVLNIDFKDDGEAHVREIAALFREYADWISRATKPENPAPDAPPPPIEYREILILVGASAMQERVFEGEVPAGEPVLAFGQARTRSPAPPAGSAEARATFASTVDPALVLVDPPTNFRRWWNNSWHIVEAGGAARAGEWTPEDEARLGAVVARARELGYWIRFYTLDGHAKDEGRGWGASYNFGSPEAVRERWNAAIRLGVDFVATDQYEAFADALREADSGSPAR